MVTWNMSVDYAHHWYQLKNPTDVNSKFLYKLSTDFGDMPKNIPFCKVWKIFSIKSNKFPTVLLSASVVTPILCVTEAITSSHSTQWVILTIKLTKFSMCNEALEIPIIIVFLYFGLLNLIKRRGLYQYFAVWHHLWYLSIIKKKSHFNKLALTGI